MYISRNTSPCHLLLLVGLKGAGKTFVGTVLERSLSIKFLQVEPLFFDFMQKHPQCHGIELEKRGFQYVVDALDAIAPHHPIISMESTGAAHTFPNLLAALRQTYHVSLIQVQAPIEVCIERVLKRDASNHIPVSDERLHAINERALHISLPWDLVLDNTTPLTKGAIAHILHTYLYTRPPKPTHV